MSEQRVDHLEQYDNNRGSDNHNRIYRRNQHESENRQQEDDLKY
jgi:hypothetical protein